MKVETSIIVEKDLQDAVDKLAGEDKNRSALIEAAIESYLAQIARQTHNARDLEIINERADELNEEALDVLDYQVAL